MQEDKTQKENDGFEIDTFGWKLEPKLYTFVESPNFWVWMISNVFAIGHFLAAKHHPTHNKPMNN